LPSEVSRIRYEDLRSILLDYYREHRPRSVTKRYTGETDRDGNRLTEETFAGADKLDEFFKRMPMLRQMRKSFPKPTDHVFNFRNFRNIWNATCGKLGLGKFDPKTRAYEGLTPHDFRRSAARNLIKAGVDRRVAMKITGHKTEHIFERYNIKSTDDVREALIKVGKYKPATVVSIG